MKIKAYDEYSISNFTGIIEICDGMNLVVDVGIEYFKNGKHHREDGPAVEFGDGKKEWVLDGCWFRNETQWKSGKLQLKK
jgi:hypothetical protein